MLYVLFNLLHKDTQIFRSFLGLLQVKILGCISILVARPVWRRMKGQSIRVMSNPCETVPKVLSLPNVDLFKSSLWGLCE